MNIRRIIARVWMLMVAVCIPLVSNQSRAEALLQLFNCSYAEIIQKMPELAEAGYNSLWLPPPTKGSGGLSVGYDMFDPFDLGSKNQRDSVSTRYGTEAQLLEMVETAHRFGIRVYFDNIMNHRAFDVPFYDENTPGDVYPGMVPEDFHLKKTSEGFYRKWDNTRDWSSEWQVQNLGLSDLIDIAQETPNNKNFGLTEGSTGLKYAFLRDFDRPEQYDKDKNGQQAYFGVLIDQARLELGTNATSAQLKAKAQEYINSNQAAFKEDIGGYMIRAVRWEMDRTKADGLRLDAVKHVPDYFFGNQDSSINSATGLAYKDTSNDGYTGGIQWQFNRTRGFSDSNHRDSVFDEKRGRDDAMVFGEHLGSPPGYGGYWDAGMRLVDNDLRSKLNGVLGNPSAGLQGLDKSDYGSSGFGASLGVMHANSHDNDYAAQIYWQHAYYMLREGIGLIYSDGYNQAETLGASGGAFPRHANTQYLGQFNDPRIPNILKLHNDFARGLQQGRWADSDYLAFERRDNRNPDGSTRSGQAADEITMVMMMNDNTAAGQARGITTSFPSGAYLYQYAEGPNGSSMVGFYKYANELGGVTVPPGGYFLFSYRTPELSTLWPDAAITLHQSNATTGQLQEVPWITVTRKDGRDGDKSFNPYGFANRGYPTNVTPADYTYQTTVPVVKGNMPLTILARADGSAENIRLRLDGGVDLNAHMAMGDTNELAKRDNPPGLRTDVFLGYEQPLFTERQQPEKFAAVNSARSKIGSPGAETFVKTIGGTVTNIWGPTNANNWADYTNIGGSVVSWHYHDPNGTVGGLSGTPPAQLIENETNLVAWSKTPSGLGNYKMFLYYTTNGTTWPEGAGGIGRGETRVAEMNFRHDQTGAEAGSWWSVTNLPKPPSGTQFRYKIGAYQTGADSRWPSNQSSVEYKKMMLTTFRITNFNTTNIQFFPHNDYARVPTLGVTYSNWPWAMQTGLSEGFHILRARAFLNRGANQAPLYQTFAQTFYYDAQAPQGAIAFPQNNGDTVGGSSYDLVIRTDPTVQEVWYNIADSEAANDDVITKQRNGNGTGFESFVDTNTNNIRDAGETFTDINGNGLYDTNPVAWAKATEVTPSLSVTSPYQKEWRFTYNNIPLTGTSSITVRLLEASSSRDLTLSNSVANASELTRQVQTRGSADRLIIAFPTNDGDSVDDNYNMQVYFPKNLSNIQITESNMINRFTFLAQGTAVDRSGWSINYGSFGPAGAFHNLIIPLPNLYNSAYAQQEFRITYQEPSNTNRMVAVRYVTVNRSTKPFIRVLEPTLADSDGKPTQLILPDNPGTTNDVLNFTVKVEASPGITNAPTLTGITSTPVSSTTNSLSVVWNYNWRITNAGSYTITATSSLNGQNLTTSREAQVILRQVVDPSGNPLADDDNDGLLNVDETTQKALPVGNAETWSNGDVHSYYAFGRTQSTCPDSDGDGLPDGLEVGWRQAPTNTVAGIDTNGDNIPNFVGDLDPPFYATKENVDKVPGVKTEGEDRTRQAAGSVTDPNNPDTDGDGLPDGVEDADVNGWTDGDGESIAATWDPWLARKWPDGLMDSSEIWQETSPAHKDSDGDGLVDGYEEDKGYSVGDSVAGKLNGRTDLMLLYSNSTTKLLLINSDLDTPLAVAGSAFRLGDRTSRAINYPALVGIKSNGVIVGGAYRADGTGTLQTNSYPKLLILETDPLSPDTDGDGLPDGWEVRNKLDPLDNGVYNFATGQLGNPINGAEGDPDNDNRSNLTEYQGGTDPRQDDRIPPVAGDGSIRIGTFQDWRPDDLQALDEYNNGGNVSDIYRLYDGYDSSRDLVAFSLRDGGDTTAQGDGKLYFRTDFLDLQSNAWQGYVDLYVVINLGNTGAGEKALPDGVNLTTAMGWQAVIAVYGQNSGTVYVDTDSSVNTTTASQNPAIGNFGVVSRGMGANGLVAAA